MSAGLRSVLRGPLAKRLHNLSGPLPMGGTLLRGRAWPRLKWVPRFLGFSSVLALFPRRRRDLGWINVEAIEGGIRIEWMNSEGAHQFVTKPGRWDRPMAFHIHRDSTKVETSVIAVGLTGIAWFLRDDELKDAVEGICLLIEEHMLAEQSDA